MRPHYSWPVPVDFSGLLGGRDADLALPKALSWAWRACVAGVRAWLGLDLSPIAGARATVIGHTSEQSAFPKGQVYTTSTPVLCIILLTRPESHL